MSSDIDEAIDAALVILAREVQLLIKKKRKKPKIWARKWIQRREILGGSRTLLRELANEDPSEYRKHMRMSQEKFEELLRLVEPTISKKDTTMRNALPARLKLEITLRFLASGDSLASLSYFFRVPVSTISLFLPEVLQAIVGALDNYLKVWFVYYLCDK